MPSLWKFAGLTPVKLIQLTVRAVGEDELTTRSAALSYYFLLALFPLFLFLVSLVGLLAGTGSQLQQKIVSTIGNLAPGSASHLVGSVVSQTFKASSGLKLAAGILGALWAASGGISAILTSLNVVYEVKETRPWWKQKVIILSLTIALAALMLFAVVLALYGAKIGETLASQIGLGSVFQIGWKILHWPVSFAAMFLSFSLVYYFAPNLTERHWYWVTPGSAAGVVLWLLASLGFRAYLHFFNSYSATYGSLGAVVILMLWLYITGFAVLAGGEVNWVIENEDKHNNALESERRKVETPLAA